MTDPVSSGWHSLDSALSQALSQLNAVTESESVPLSSALGRVLASPIVAKHNVPPWDNSAMDGYAVIASNAVAGKTLKVTDTLLAGMNGETFEVTPDTAIRIMTGAPVPRGATAVIMQENTCRLDNAIEVLQTARAGENIRPMGCDIAQGDTVIVAGTRLSAAHLMLIASLGADSVSVFRKLRVGLMATGDELVSAGEECRPGQIYESNRAGIAGLLAPFEVEILDLGIVPDEPQRLKNTFKQAASEVDLLISSGGVSVGDADFVKAIVAELGRIDFWKVAIKPGKPFAFGQLGKAIFCGVPGNPVSSYVTTQKLVLPIVRHLQGESAIAESRTLPLKARLKGSINRKPGRLDFQRAHVTFDDQNQAWVSPLPKQSSAIMTTVTSANCFMLIEQNVAELNDGDWVCIQPFDLYGLWK
ncbi:molybdopterin molybdenumtransferase MoeA [Alteromonas aestuariivivens]|uniref:Molybdopterin molybdenumtransferase n=1 Tax=Alteromonas aestuariivivens TaxID=1938339 RepID=A0A3D8MAM1_9ALTE|nr:gephyrin-like molybdotransferase Glp [Alteromonas aestuariivivens]RDV27340.1 molybdopterin molybdenumtransferase MoeA [Alteromonas aestuariivivens]